MPDPARLDIEPEEVDRRLRELGQLYELGRALREVRFLDERVPDRVRESPNAGGPGSDRQDYGQD